MNLNEPTEAPKLVWSKPALQYLSGDETDKSSYFVEGFDVLLSAPFGPPS